jgi:type II secretory pathway component PulF
VPTFDYTALKPGVGGEIRSRIEADTERDARQKIRNRGETPMKIKEIRTVGSNLQKYLPSISFSRHSKNVQSFTEQMQRLIRSGISLTSALQVLSSQTDSKDFSNLLKLIYSGVVERGLSFADALREHPLVFSKLYVAMVHAGETTGTLPSVLERLGQYSKKKSQIESKVISALTYPCIMVTIGLCVVIFLLNFLVPKMEKLLSKKGESLPKATEILLDISNLTQNYWWAFAFGALICFFGYQFTASTKKGRFFLDNLYLRTPIFGEIIRKSSISRFAITLSSLLRSGVKIESALRIVEEVVGNSVVALTMKKVGEGIREGESIAKPLEESHIFPKMVIYMISVGESAGSEELQDTLDNIAEDYDHEMEQSASKLTTLLTPLLLLVMAGMVVFILLAVLLPLMDLSKIKG